MKPAARAAVLISAAWGTTVAVAAYALVRSIQFFIYPDPNPTTLVWSAHAGFFWRCWTCAYAGGIAGFVAFLFARRNPGAASRSLVAAVATAAAMLALQVTFLP